MKKVRFNLREVCESRGRSVEDVCLKLGLERIIPKVNLNWVQSVRFSILEALCNELQCDISDILVLEDTV